MEFNIKRFIYFCRQIFIENKVILLKLLGLHVAFIGFFIASGYGIVYTTNEKNVFIAFEVLAMLSTSTFVWFLMHSLLKKRYVSTNKKAHYLCIPHSITERWLADYLIFGVLFPIILLAIFYGLEEFAAYIFSNPLSDSKIEGSFFFNRNRLLLVVTIFILISFSTIHDSGGSAKKSWFGLTFIIFVLLMPFNTLLDYVFFQEKVAKPFSTRYLFQPLHLENNHELYENFLVFTGWAENQILLYVGLPIALLLSAIYYFKLKEMEI